MLLPSLYILLLLPQLPQASLRSPLDFVTDLVDHAVGIAGNTVEVAIEVSDALEGVALDGVEGVFGEKGRDLAEFGIGVGPGRFSRLGKGSRRLGLLDRPSRGSKPPKGLGAVPKVKKAVPKVKRGVRALAGRKRYDLLKESVEVKIGPVKFVCDIVAQGLQLACIDIIRSPAEYSAVHEVVGFGDEALKRATLSGPDAASDASKIGSRPGNALLLQTEFWICVDDAECREWSPPTTEIPKPKPTGRPRVPY